MLLDSTKANSQAIETTNELFVDIMTTPIVSLLGMVQVQDNLEKKITLMHAMLSAAYEAGQNNNKEEK